MTTLVTADWHLTDQPKDRYRFKALEWLLDQLAERQVERLIILGDLTHQKNFHSDTLVNDVVGYLHKFAKLCPIHVLQGNHDYVETNNAFFQFTRLLHDVNWIWTPRYFDVAGLGRCIWLPHTRDYEKDWIEIRKEWEYGVPDLIFAHNAFEGAVAESGKRLSGIPLSIFPPDTQIISGDIHEPQQVGENLIYVGAPYTQKFGDNFTPRVLLISNGRIESIDVPGPQKRLIEVYGGRMDFAKYVKYKDDMVKVRYHLKTSERDNWSKLKENIKHWFPDAVIQPVLEYEEMARAKQSSRSDDKQLLKDYGKQQNLSPDMLVTGYELLNEA